MIFKSIRIKEGMFERIIKFSDFANLIHSAKNSSGKTTLLRFMLYGLGYNIPNTRKIKFERCEVNLEIECENSGTIKFARSDLEFIEIIIDSSKQTFVLPEQRRELHALIWGTSSTKRLKKG